MIGIENSNTSKEQAQKPPQLTNRITPPVDPAKAKKGTIRARKTKRVRIARPYPASSFEEALKLAESIQRISPGGKARRLTLCEHMKISPTSSSTTMLITNSGKYGITKGSYVAEWIELTPDGALASSADAAAGDRLRGRFRLAIQGIKPFNALYEEQKGKRLSAHSVMKDFLRVADPKLESLDECVDTFVVNVKFLGLLRMIAGSEVLIPIDQAIDEVESTPPPTGSDAAPATAAKASLNAVKPNEKTVWSTTCFYISPIGKEGSEQRKHSDLFLNSIIEPALKEFGLKVVRADKIGETGMITSQILEHILKSKLVIVDLSFHNPNAFYELAIRHACKLPIVQIIRTGDTIPFDVNQIRTIAIDNTDIYSLIPRLETFRSEIATQVRQALASPEAVSNPLTVFCPGLRVSLPE